MVQSQHHLQLQEREALIWLTKMTVFLSESAFRMAYGVDTGVVELEENREEEVGFPRRSIPRLKLGQIISRGISTGVTRSPRQFCL